MVFRPGGRVILDNLEVKRGGSSALSNLSALGNFKYSPKAGLFMLEEFTWNNSVLTITDSGGVNGGWIAHKLADVNTTRYAGLVGFLNISVHSVGSGINASGTINFGIGHEPATTQSIIGNPSDLTGPDSVILTSGSGSNTSAGPTITEYVTVTASPSIWLNVGIADADISTTSDVTFSGLGRVYLLDLSRGV